MAVAMLPDTPATDGVLTANDAHLRALEAEAIHIEVTREEYQRLNVPKGQAVHLRPRAAKAFPGGQP